MRFEYEVFAHQSASNMKAQIRPAIKAHLVRGAFYLLLLLAVCAIPFALAQRKIAKQSLAKPGVAQNGAMQGVTQRAMMAIRCSTAAHRPPQHRH